MGPSSESYPSSLGLLRFKNVGMVSSNSSYQLRTVPSIYNEQYTYMATTASGARKAAWTNLGGEGGLDLLFERKPHQPTLSTPPSGMRSSVPLGPLGEGSIEMRADGRLADWGTIFNNGPYASKASWASKMDIDHALFGLSASDTAPAMLRTHPPDASQGEQPFAGVDFMSYEGAFPVSRLNTSLRGSLGISLTAFSHFAMHSPNRSVAPIVYFAFKLTNRARKPTNASVFFNLPDALGGGQVRGGAGPSDFVLAHPSHSQPSLEKQGELAWTLVHSTSAAHGCIVSADSLAESWGEFAKAWGGCAPARRGVTRPLHVSSITTLAIEGGGSQTLTFGLSWFYPHRMWGRTELGHFYHNLYDNAEHVAAAEAPRLDETLQHILRWQSACFDNSLPAAVQDSLINTPAAWGKTALYTRDGRWRQFESHSCAQMEPPHIHSYRALGYILLLPSLESGALSLYSSALAADGGVQEAFGCRCEGCASKPCDLDRGSGGARGDDNPAYLLDVYANWKWRNSTAWMLAHKEIVRVLEFTLSRAPPPCNLTYRMVNTNDEHGVIGDVNAYNAVLFLACLAAGVELAQAMGEISLASRCRKALVAGRLALRRLLWRGRFWAQAWCPNATSDALQSETFHLAALLSLSL